MHAIGTVQDKPTAVQLVDEFNGECTELDRAICAKFGGQMHHGYV